MGYIDEYKHRIKTEMSADDLAANATILLPLLLKQWAEQGVDMTGRRVVVSLELVPTERERHQAESDEEFDDDYA